MRGVTGKEWIVLSHRITPPQELVSKHGRVLAQLIVNRGFEDKEEELFELKLKHIAPYHSIPNIERAVDRIIHALKKGERIILFGDYDVDGITGTAILYEVLKHGGGKVIPVLPNRSNGYGLNERIISLFSKYGELLITIDNGTSAVEEIDRASIDVVVLDHHNVPERIPERAILVNPRLEEDVHPELKGLSSSAMCFYISALIVKELGLDFDVRQLLDLVAIGTVGDIMPMNRTNRILVSKGLSLMEGISRGSIVKPGIKALLSSSRLKNNLSVKDIAFSIAPRLNAPGRVGNPRLSLSLLVEKNEQRATLLARKIESLNSVRRRITEKVYKEARSQAESSPYTNFLSLWGKEWHVGVLGIVAGRLSREIGKPVAVFSRGGSHSVGSVRSIEGVDVYKGLSKLSHMFLK